MAHLTRCWCGRVYRCEQDHTPPPNILRCFDIEPQHDDCPDYLFHGPRFLGEFTKLTIDKFKIPFPLAEGIKDAILANSVKDPDAY